ncbi:hypothetical protein TSUD_348930 [Trifolium subterraneum]|uniref:Uncharacterized protein n=1 Tax=Trifolium subterraneum TaxID=3900 RepID=A0A2Z6NAN3_TRISU|nr:hypothetical protein TSUD_348930 [Trifolium subterraneum]
MHAQAGDKANDDKGDVDSPKTTKDTADELPVVKQCCKTNVPTSDLGEKKVEEKSIDKLIKDELVELREKSKKRFAKLESGCNGVVFVQMRKKDEDKSPKDIVTRITQIMVEQMEELRKRERHLADMNKQLRLKLESEGFNLKAMESLWSSNNSIAGNSNFTFQPPQTNPMTMNMDIQAEPFLQIGYQQYVQAEASNVSKSMACQTNFMHGWIL